MNGEPGDELKALAVLAREIGAEPVARDADELAARVGEGRFFVACVGQFKRGKSTLINALVGSAVLPVGVNPVTSIPTILRFGPLGARICDATGRWQDVPTDTLTDYVTETGNPGNRRGVSVVEVFCPSDALAGGMCLIDTPGLGSVFAENTAATRAFVPHIDAAVVVLGADPPISGDELALVRDIASEVRDLIFVLNKADRVPEEDREQARVFAEEVLSWALGRPAGRLLEVSALEHLRGKSAAKDWETLVARLSRLSRDRGADLVVRAARRGRQALCDRLLHILDAREQALLAPEVESIRRIEALGAVVAQVETFTREAEPLFLAEQRRLATVFARWRESFVDVALPQATREMGRVLADPSITPSAAFQIARETASRLVSDWIRERAPAARANYEEVATRFLQLGNEILQRARGAAGDGAARFPVELPSDAGFRIRSQYVPTDLMQLTGSGGGGLASSISRRVLRRRAGRYLARLLVANAHRAEGDWNERVLESRRRLVSEIRRVVQEVRDTATDALARARRERAAGRAAVDRELQRVAELRARALAIGAEGDAI